MNWDLSVLNKNNKNTNPNQKLKISKSQFSQTQQNHQILKPQSTKSIKKYNTTNPNKKISNSETLLFEIVSR